MKESMSSSRLLNNAGAAGAAFGAISVAYMFLSQPLTGEGAGVWSTVINFILWAAKFIGCIFLMRFFMKRFVRKYGVTDNSVTMRFGIATAFFSALIFSAVTLANVLIINPRLIKEQMDIVYQAYGSMLDSNTMSMLEKIEGSMPQIMFFSNMIYCFLYGTLLSAILSRNIPPKDPFANCSTDSINTEE